MIHTKAIQQTIVLLYLAITLAAFVFTMTRIRVLPEIVTRWSYGMMAPYQGDTDFNDDLWAEGKRTDGTWEQIDLDPYFPVGFGERNVRKHLKTFAEPRDHQWRAFNRFAILLLARKHREGVDYAALRLTWLQWPRSPGGFEFLRSPLFWTAQPITTVTWQ